MFIDKLGLGYCILLIKYKIYNCGRKKRSRADKTFKTLSQYEINNT